MHAVCTAGYGQYLLVIQKENVCVCGTKYFYIDMT